MSEGIIYILTNKSMPDYIKIGFTSRDNIKTRLKELYSTGVPLPFELHYAAKVNDAKLTESTLHKIFDIHRENSDREFFKMDPERARLVLELVLKLTKGEEIVLDDSEVYEQQDQEIISKSRKSPAPSFRFDMVGIKEGETLIFSRDENITCIVSQNNKVEFEGNIYSLSALAQKLLGYSYGIQGPAFWLYQGKLLRELRKEVEEQDGLDG